MLTSLVLTLEPTTTATVQVFMGRAVHAWFLDQVRNVDPALSETLHAPHVAKPFTVSPLWSPSARPQRGSLQLQAGVDCYFRITSVETNLSRCVLETLTPAWPGVTVHLSGVPFHIRKVVTQTGEHPQARVLSYTTLIEQTEERKPPSGIELRFLTPTTFRRTPPRDAPFGDDPYDVPLPLPERIFSGLLDLWNTFAPQPLPEELVVFARDCVVVSRYRLRTELISFGSGRRGRVGGFVGQCRFAIRCPDVEWRRRIGLLAAFAPFAGIGWRTTMGMGQVHHITT